jgi:hypothetical protein
MSGNHKFRNAWRGPAEAREEAADAYVREEVLAVHRQQ